MFDIGFTELLLIGIVALLVVGPEKLPSVIRTGLQYFRQFKSGVSHIRDEVERELALEDIKKNVDDGKSELSQAIGYDDLHESLNELKQESANFYDVGEWQTSHDDGISDAEIEADLSHLEDEVGPPLPDADEYADTGVEMDVEPTIMSKKAKKKPLDKVKNGKTDKIASNKKSKKKSKKKASKTQSE